MVPEIKKIVLALLVSGLIGGVFGGILGGLAADFLSLEFFVWVGVSTLAGLTLGLGLAYGLLPER